MSNVVLIFNVYCKYYSLLDIGDSNDCSVDNGNCEEICTQSDCRCPNGQTLIRTSCVCKFDL